MNYCLRVGLTGGIGSGKSEAGKIFRELGVKVVDCDEISHDLLGLAGNRQAIANRYPGKGLINKAGEVQRSKLRRLLFTTNRELQWIETLLHPQIIATVQKKIIEWSDEKYIVALIPLLFECHLEYLVDRTLLVTADSEIRLERLRSRSDWDQEDVLKVMEKQIGTDQLADQADDVIENNGSAEELKSQIIQIHEKYQKEHDKITS